MKTARAEIKLSKDHSVPGKLITPLEAMILIALHRINVGDIPVVFEKKNEEKTTKGTDGKETKVTVEVIVHDKDVDRSLDDELNRLRMVYGPHKVSKLRNEVAELPTTFEDAITKGMKLSLASSGLLQSNE